MSWKRPSDHRTGGAAGSNHKTPHNKKHPLSDPSDSGCAAAHFRKLLHESATLLVDLAMFGITVWGIYKFAAFMVVMHSA